MHGGVSSGRQAALPSAVRIITFSSIAGAMTVFGQTAGISVFIDPLIADLAESRAEISTAFSVSCLIAAFAMPWIGHRIDQQGIRRTVITATVLFGAAIIGLSQVGTLAGLALGFLALRLFGAGALNLAARVVVVVRFRVSPGRAVGLSGALTTVGLSLLTIVLSAGIEHLGWRETWALSGPALLLVVIPLTLWALRPDSDRAMFAEAQLRTPALDDWTRARAVGTGMFWAITLVVAANALVITGVTFHQISILGEAGLSPTRAAANFLPQTIASVATIALVGTLADRLPGKALLGLSMVLLALATLTIRFLDDGLLPIVYGVLLGAAGGIGFAAEGVLYPRYFGVSAIASIRGLAFAVSVGAAAIGPIVIGVSYSPTDGYGTAAAILIVIPIAIGIGIMAVRAPLLPRAGDSHGGWPSPGS